MLTAYNLNRNPRNLSTLTVPEYPIIDGEKPERYRTAPQSTALDGSGDRTIDAQEAMKLGFDLEKHITFRRPGGMNPFGGFKSTARVGKLDRFTFDFGHNSRKDEPENRQYREPFSMPSGVNPSFEIDVAPAQPYTPVHRLRRRQDTQTLVTPLYSDLANVNTAHLSNLVSNKRMLANRDGTEINTTKLDPLASNKNYGDEARAASVSRVAGKEVTTHNINAGHYNTAAHGATEASRATADLRAPKELPRWHTGQHIEATKNVEGNFKTEVKINPDLLLPRRDFMEMKARQETDYRVQPSTQAGSYHPGERLTHVPESDIRRQAGYETGYRTDASSRTRRVEMDNHYQRDGINVDSRLTSDQSGHVQLRTGASSVRDPNALRQYDYYAIHATKEPQYKPEVAPDVPTNLEAMHKTMPDQDIHSGASNPGTARDMMPRHFRLSSDRGNRQTVSF